MVGANRNDSILLLPTLERLARFDHGLGYGIPEQITVHLDAGYDSTKNTLLHADARWGVERTSSWHGRGLECLVFLGQYWITAVF